LGEGANFTVDNAMEIDSADVSSSVPGLALPAPHIEIDALPYIDSQYNDPEMKARVDSLVQAEMRTFRPGNYLAHLPEHEVNFPEDSVLQYEWMRVCEQQPMSKMDTKRYQLEPPPPEQRNDPEAWQRAVRNAEAQLEHQSTRLGNLELMQQHGAHQWRAQLNELDVASAQLKRAAEEVDERIELVNRRRKTEQLAAAPRLAALEAEWVSSVKKNLEIESACLQLEAECAGLRNAVEVATSAPR
jgi:pre-mRNA-splicing factor SPF27